MGNNHKSAQCARLALIKEPRTIAASVLMIIKNHKSIKTCEALVICKTNGSKTPNTIPATQYRHFIWTKNFNDLFKFIPPLLTLKVYCLILPHFF